MNGTFSQTMFFDYEEYFRCVKKESSLPSSKVAIRYIYIALNRYIFFIMAGDLYRRS